MINFVTGSLQGDLILGQCITAGMCSMFIVWIAYDLICTIINYIKERKED